MTASTRAKDYAIAVRDAITELDEQALYEVKTKKYGRVIIWRDLQYMADDFYLRVESTIVPEKKIDKSVLEILNRSHEAFAQYFFKHKQIGVENMPTDRPLEDVFLEHVQALAQARVDKINEYIQYADSIRDKMVQAQAKRHAAA